MKTWQKMVILGAAYVTYILTGLFYSANKAQEYRKQAIVIADTNKNGHIDPEEALKMLRETGHNTYDIFAIIPPEEKSRILEQRVLQGREEGDASLLRSILRKVLPYHNLSKSSIANERYEYYEKLDTLDALAWTALTNDASQSSNSENVKTKVEAAFCEAYRGRCLDDFIKVLGWDGSKNMSIAPGLFRVFIYPYRITEGSELEQYVNSSLKK